MTRPVEAQARRDTERALELDRIIKGAQSGPNPLRSLAEHHTPAPVERTEGGACIHCNMAAGFDHYGWCPSAPAKESILADRQATREDSKRRRLSRFAHLLCVELRAREIAGAGLHPEERGRLMEVITEARRALTTK